MRVNLPKKIRYYIYIFNIFPMQPDFFLDTLHFFLDIRETACKSKIKEISGHSLVGHLVEQESDALTSERSDKYDLKQSIAVSFLKLLKVIDIYETSTPVRL